MTEPLKSANWRVSVAFLDMTWGDLRALMAYAAHLPDETEVEYDWYESESPREPDFPTAISVPGRDS
jgi:hypothetical protein